MKKIIAIHVDGGKGVGLGRASRGIGLAHALRLVGFEPIFVISPESSLQDYFKNRRLHAVTCNTARDALLEACSECRADVLVIDSYRIGGRDLATMRDSGIRIVCFDDAADRDLMVDVVVNGSPAAPNLPYKTKPWTKRLVGPAYQVVRPGFVPIPNRQYPLRPRRILVTVGGDDLFGIFNDLLFFFAKRVLTKWVNVEVEFIVGPFFKPPREREVPDTIDIHTDPKDMPSLMLKADIAVCAGGQTLYELARCGTPTVAFCVGEDQVRNLDTLSQLGVIDYIGWAGMDGWLNKLECALDRMRADPLYREAMGRVAANLIDGLGALRVARVIADLVQRKTSLPRRYGKCHSG